MAKTGDLQELRDSVAGKTEFGFVLYDKNGRPRASFAFSSVDEARRGKESMDLALAHVTAEEWP